MAGYYGAGRGGYQNSAPRREPLSPDDVTNGLQLNNVPAGKSMDFTFNKDTLRVQITSVQPGQPITWEIRKNAPKVSQTLYPNDLVAIETMISAVIDEIKERKTFKNVSIRCGYEESGKIEFNNGQNLGLTPGIYFVIYRNIDSSGRAGEIDVYPFAGIEMDYDFNPQTGSSTPVVDNLHQLKMFKRVIKSASEAFTKAHAHAIKREGKLLSTRKGLGAVAKSMGVDVSDMLESAIKRNQSTQSQATFNTKPPQYRVPGNVANIPMEQFNS